MENTTIDVTALSSKGQIVLPKNIRDELLLKVGDKFVVFSDGENILLKPIHLPNKEDFDILMAKAKEWAKNVGMIDKDINEAIQFGRKGKK